MVWTDYPRAWTCYRTPKTKPAVIPQQKQGAQQSSGSVRNNPAALRVAQEERLRAAEREFQRQLRMAEQASLAESMAKLQEMRERREREMLDQAKLASLEEGSNRVQLALEASRLAAKAVAYNLQEVEVPRDGNCQFHSVSQSLMESPQVGHLSNMGQETLDHVVVRQQAVAWLREHPDFRLNAEDPDTSLCLYLDTDPSWEAYCGRMSRTGQYGDHLTLIAIAEVFSCCVVVMTSQPDAVNYHVRPHESTPHDTLYLAHYEEAQHYNRLFLKGEVDVVQGTLDLGDHLTTGFAYKVQCPNGQLRRIRTEYNATQGRLRLGHAELREHIAHICQVARPESLLLRWHDGDGDLITFDTDEELLDAVRCSAAAGHKVLRVLAEECPLKDKPLGCLQKIDADAAAAVVESPVDCAGILLTKSSGEECSEEWFMVDCQEDDEIPTTIEGCGERHSGEQGSPL